MRSILSMCNCLLGLHWLRRASNEEARAQQAAFLLLIGEKTLLHDALGAIADALEH